MMNPLSNGVNPGCYMTINPDYVSYFVMDIVVLSTFNITELPYEVSITSLSR